MIRILILGDSGVGKSSLISSYVSRHFPEEVPSVMTDAIIPSDTTANNVNVTIMDSSARAGDREVLKQKLRAADSVIALYDASRHETLESLSQEWLPLIKDVCSSSNNTTHNDLEEGSNSNINKPVVIVGTKIDLLGDSEENRVHEESEILRSILRKFPFVLACCRASAKLLNVDSVFYHGELVVTFPLGPLFDVSLSEFTPQCKRALLRIFRVYDCDRDGLLSDHELCTLQQSCFDVTLRDEDVTAVKKQIAKSTTRGLRNNRTTFEGLMGIMSIFVERSQPQIPWTILRRNGYDDLLNLTIPVELYDLVRKRPDQITELTPGAYTFLMKLAFNANAAFTASNSENGFENTESNNTSEEVLSFNAIKTILSVIPSSVKLPWDDPPIFDDLGLYLMSELSSNTNYSCSIDSWIAQWQMFAVLRPSLTQVLLYRLGYADQSDLGIQVNEGRLSNNYNRKTISNRSVLHVCVLGDVGVGKTSFLRALSGLNKSGTDDSLSESMISNNSDILESKSGVFMHGSCYRYITGHSSSSSSSSSSIVLNNTVYIVATEVPFKEAANWLQGHGESYDAVVLLFNDIMISFETAKQLEALIPENVPRLYFANIFDQEKHISASSSANAGTKYVTENELVPLQTISTKTGDGISEAITALTDVISCPELGIPKSQRDAKIRKVFRTRLFYTISALGAISLVATATVIYLRKNEDINTKISNLWKRK